MGVSSGTRVCVKNLPPNTTERDLKEFLFNSSSSKNQMRLEITDCRILKNEKGKSRKVAFVGFRQIDQANFVVETFDKAFLGMSRLSVEPALAKKAKEEPKVNILPDKNGTKKEGESSDEKTKLKRDTEKGSKFWANDVEDVGPISVPTEDENDEISSTSNDESDRDSDASVSDDESQNTRNQKGKTNVSALISDLDFLRSKQSGVEELKDDSSSSSSLFSSTSSSSSVKKDDKQRTGSISHILEHNLDIEKENSKRDRDECIQDADKDFQEEENNDDTEIDSKKEEASQCRLFIRNLPFATTENELSDYFSSFGKVSECHIPMDDKMENNKGFAFVTFVSAADAFAAKTNLDKTDFQGRLLHILTARPAPSSTLKVNDRNITWKQRKELEKKEKETTSREAAQGWSASFVRGDTVVDNLADKLGLRKGELLGVKDKLSSGDAAVRLALGETQIIEENRQYFKKHGVDMDSLVSADGNNDQITKRSKTSILVKNLPFDTRVEELTKLFQVGESSIEVLLPPSRSIALIEYGHSADAKKAFRKLAYRRFKHVPIYLEWAPLAAVAEPSQNPSEPKTTLSPDAGDMDTDENPEHFDEDEGTSDITSTIFVKNLNFQTSEEILKSVFEKSVGGVRAVRIPKKITAIKSQDQESRALSMGFGFVELSSRVHAEKAISKLNGKSVDGHAWELTISSSKSNAPRRKHLANGSKNPTKLVVRNVPFQATRKEILKLFGSFGQLRKVRLPKKFDGSHRGFAFVEFLTSKEALAAMNALSRTHLYGRHLVLEWATNDDQNVNLLREKAKRDTSTVPAAPKNKKIRFTD